MTPKEDSELQRQIEANEGIFEPLLEPYPERKRLVARLKALQETSSVNMHEFSRLTKEAEASAWAEERTRCADAAFDSGGWP